MLEKIMDLVKGQVMDSVGGMPGIPEDKKGEVVETTAHSMMDGLKKYATSGGISKITSMLGMGGSGAGAGSGMASTLESTVVSALTSKVNLSPAVAQKIAATVIPAVMSLMKKKVDDDNEPGFNLESIVGGLTGKSAAGGSGGGIMNMLGGILGKK
jgi:hypothetical protein